MAYDRDGSIVATVDSGGSIVQQAAGVLTALNNESGGRDLLFPAAGPSRVVVLFPQLHDLIGFYAADDQNSGFGTIALTAEVSTDTTTGNDGTWTGYRTQFDARTAVSDIPISPGYRSNIWVGAAAGVKALRLSSVNTNQPTLSALHIYGDISAGSEGDSLQLWDPAVDQRIAAAALDFGDVPRSNVSQKQFRVKNRSATKTANSVVVGLEALTDATPSLGSQYQFSLDGSTWASTVTVTSIAPGAISPLVYVRRSTDAAAALSVWAARVTCVPGSWT